MAACLVIGPGRGSGFEQLFLYHTNNVMYPFFWPILRPAIKLSAIPLGKYLPC